MNIKISLLVVLLCTSSFGAGMEQTETPRAQQIPAHPIHRQTSGKSTSLTVNEPALPVVVDHTASEHTAFQRIRHSSTCPEIPRKCIYAFAAAVLVYVVFLFVPLPQ